MSLSTACLSTFRLEEAFATAKRLGFDGVELVANLEVAWRGAGYVRSLADRWEVPVLSVHYPMLPVPGWGGAARYLKALRLAQELEAPVLVIHSKLEKGARAANDPDTLAIIERCRELASPVEIAIENDWSIVGRREYQELRTDPRQQAEQLRAFAEQHDMGITFDTCHAAMMEWDLRETYKVFRPNLRNIHLSDRRSFPVPQRTRFLHSQFVQHQAPGIGHLQLDTLLGELERDDYPGLVTLEITPVAMGFRNKRRAAEVLADALAFCRVPRLTRSAQKSRSPK